MHENEISFQIIGAAIKIHKLVGPGLLESVYENLLFHELDNRGFHIEQQKGIPLKYEDVKIKESFRADLIIEGKVIVEVKSIEKLAPVHFAQTLTYLRLTNIKLGLLINFNSTLLKNSIHRIVNNL